MRLLKILLLLTFFPRLISAQNNFITDSLDSYIQREMQRWNIPAVAVAVVKNDKIVYMKGFGVCEIGKPNKVDENTLFMIASNTKAFTATALSLLSYEKRLSLDDKITKWMPDFKLYDDFATREATIRDMLCHRIGFQTFQSDFLNWGCNQSRKALINNMQHVKPMFSFRSKFGYCNACFLTAGEIIPIVTDTTWDDFLRYAIFQPLKMNRTSTQQKGILTDGNAAKPYTMVNNQLVLLPYDSIDNVGPCGSINSSVKDISNWIIMQLDSGRFEGKQIIPFEVLQATRLSNTIVGERYDPLFESRHFFTYGLGWFLRDYEGRKIISHDGGADGFVTNTTLIPEEKSGFVVLTNTDANSFYSALSEQLTDAVLNVPYRNLSEINFQEDEAVTKEQNAEIKRLQDIAYLHPKTAFALNNYAGNYTNEVYGSIEIKLEKNTLRIYFSKHPHLTGQLEPLGENNFLCTYNHPGYGIKETPFEISDNKVAGITIKVNDFIDYQPYYFKKTK